jgi:hypothetical protein
LPQSGLDHAHPERLDLYCQKGDDWRSNAHQADCKYFSFGVTWSMKADESYIKGITTWA